MYAYLPSMWWDLVAEALAVGFYRGRRSLLRQR